jgi:hypothetical protein
MNDTRADMFEQKIRAVMAEYPGVAPHRDIDVPIGPFDDLAYALESSLRVYGLTFIVDASYGHGLVSVIAIIGSSERPVWRLTAHCADYYAVEPILRPNEHAKHKPFAVTVFSGLACTKADKPHKLGRSFQIECDDLTGLTDYLMQYVDDARFGAEMFALRKIALNELRQPSPIGEQRTSMKGRDFLRGRIPKHSEMHSEMQAKWNDLAASCKNIGYDLRCGACAELFFTGVRTSEHAPGCETNQSKEVSSEPEVRR